MPLRFSPERGASVLLSASSRGPAGAAATIAVGSVTALSPGSTPTVANGGTSAAATLNFGLPTTPTIAIGSTATLSAGATAYATNVGSASGIILNFGLPQGVAGSNGAVAVSGTPVSNQVAIWDDATTLRATNTISVSQGGTGRASGVPGAILYYSATNTTALTASLATNAVVIGGGTSGPSTVSATVGQIWIAQSAAAPVGTSLTGDVTMNASGVTAIGTNKVSFAMISTGALATVTNVWGNASSVVTPVSSIWGAGAITTLTFVSAGTDLDMSLGINFELNMTGNATLNNPTNQKAGQTGAIFINQDSTGTRTLAYGTNWKFPSSGTAPVLTTTTNALDMLVYHVKATNFIVANLVKKFA